MRKYHIEKNAAPTRNMTMLAAAVVRLAKKEKGTSGAEANLVSTSANPRRRTTAVPIHAKVNVDVHAWVLVPTIP